VRARASEGEGEETDTRNKTRRTEKIVAAQQACKLLHSRGSHTEMRGMRPRLPSILIYSSSS